MAHHVSPAHLRALRHDAAEAELRAHPAPERCDCPGHDVFLALAAVAAAYSHEDLPAGASCASCGHREPGPLPDVAPGQLAAWPEPRPVGSLLTSWADAEDGAVVEAMGGLYVRPWDPA